jgi:DNA-directed RNA polymerase subunit RPC12/RpoP
LRFRAAAPIDPATLPEDLGVDWSRWADGRAYRLKRKKDFPNVSPGHARTAVELAATKMGKVARTVRDKMIPEKLIWVQFADAEIAAGQPCPRCGSRRLLNLHADVVRCPQCKAQLLLSNQGLEAIEAEPADGGETLSPAKRARLAARLQALQSVHLQLSGEPGHHELYTGWGERDGSRFIVLAEFDPPEDDEELTAEAIDQRIRELKVLPAHLFEGLVDVNELAVRPDADWDLIL